MGGEAFLGESWALKAFAASLIPDLALALASLVGPILSLVYPSLYLYLLAPSARRQLASLLETDPRLFSLAVEAETGWNRSLERRFSKGQDCFLGLACNSPSGCMVADYMAEELQEYCMEWV